MYNTFIAGNRKSISNKLLAEEAQINEESTILELSKDIVPTPFDLDKELSHINKAHRQKRQGSNQKDKYVLYILDSSGSIGEDVFKNMTDIMAQFSLFYCKGTKIAAMSYSSSVYRNFCFNCDQTATVTRYNAIKNIDYLNGATATGDAIQCACDYMLNSPCGFPRLTGQNAPELDVIILTDGRSNRGRNVCSAANCWSSFYNINVFPIGVGGRVNYQELDCIKGSTVNGANPFNLRDFVELRKLLEKVKKRSKKGKCIN